MPKKRPTTLPKSAKAGFAALAPPAWVIALVLALGTGWAFWPVSTCDFVNYDDPNYISMNRQVLNGLTKIDIFWAFHTIHGANWHPLTWLSLMLDVQIFGTGPRGPHLVNLLFHVANSLLLFAVLRQFTGAVWRSALVAALFALHPLHVESVAWISERKDVLSTFFGFLTLWAYGRYAQARDSHNKRALVFYLLACLTFALGLMSKPMLVTWPFILLLLDFWPLRRWPDATWKSFISAFPRLAGEKIPFFLLSAISCVITFLVQRQGGAVQPLSNFALAERMQNALVAYIRYLGKMLWPADLVVLYPLSTYWPIWQVLGAAALIVGLCMASIWFARRFPFMTTGWFWFLGTLVPVIGLIQVGDQAMADRYTYVPLVGIFIVLAWGAGELAGRWRQGNIIAGGLAALALIACALQTRVQVGYWRNSGTLFSHAIAGSKNNHVAYGMRGQYLRDQGMIDDAVKDFQTALQINPLNGEAHNNLGGILANRGQVEQAATEYLYALQLNPNNASAHNNLGALLASRGNYDEAIDHYRRALALDPDDAHAHNNLGNALRHKGQVAEALEHYHTALEINPNFEEAHYNLANALAREHKTDEAIEQFRIAIRIKPDFVAAHCNLGYALAQQGRRDEAIAELVEALRLQPDLPEAKLELQKLGAVPDK